MSKFNIGDKVKWNDPAIEEFAEDRELQESRVFEVVADTGWDCYLIADKYGEVEVPSDEIMKLRMFELVCDGIVRASMVNEQDIKDVYGVLCKKYPNIEVVEF